MTIYKSKWKFVYSNVKQKDDSRSEQKKILIFRNKNKRRDKVYNNKFNKMKEKLTDDIFPTDEDRFCMDLNPP